MEVYPFAVGLLLGGSIFWIFDYIDYIHFDHYLKKRFFPNSKSIIVLDDEDTWGSDAFHIKVSDSEFSRLMDGEPVRGVIEDEERWRTL